MARNLFIVSTLALLAGCTSPELPPSSSGVEPLTITPTGTPVAPATGAKTEPTVRQK